MDLYRQLADIRVDITKALTRIEVIDSRNTGTDKMHADYETRLRTLETFRLKLLGAVVAVSAGVSAGGTWIGLTVARH
jgi:hypothetical protein